MPYQLQPSVGKDPLIKDLSRSSVPTQPPQGYRPLRAGEKTPSISEAAQKILWSFDLGDQIPFTADGEKYMGRVEPHYHSPPPPGTDPSEYGRYPKPWGFHKGVTVYKFITVDHLSPVDNFQPEKPVSGRIQLLERMNNLIDEFDGS